MTLPIVSADERLRERRSAKIVLQGIAGVGKTTQLKKLSEQRTLFVDLESGDLAVQDWHGDTLRPQSWPEFRDLVVFLAGPNPVAHADQPFSAAHYAHVCERYGDPAQIAKYDTYFVDSLTVLSRLCLAWCKAQPAAISEKTGKPDTRGAYGLLGTEMISALTHLQHARDKHVVYVAILEERTDDFGRKVYTAQLEGSKTGLELPGIVDEVVTLAILKADDGSLFRGFVCRPDNPWGLPAKDRSGRLQMVEEPDLGRLIRAITAAQATTPDTPSIPDSQGA